MPDGVYRAYALQRVPTIAMRNGMAAWFTGQSVFGGLSVFFGSFGLFLGQDEGHDGADNEDDAD